MRFDVLRKLRRSVHGVSAGASTADFCRRDGPGDQMMIYFRPGLADVLDYPDSGNHSAAL